MKTFLILMALCGPTNTWSSPAQKTEESGQRAHVLQLDEDFPIEKLESLGIVTHPISAIGSNDELLPPSVQKRMFREAGLTPYVQNWDAFEQDHLALRCQNQKVAAVVKLYKGKIPPAVIQKYQSLFRRYLAQRASP